jgi:lipoprotein NlpI
MNHATIRTVLAVLLCAAGVPAAGDDSPEQAQRPPMPYPVPAERLAEINASLNRYLKELSQAIAADPQDPELYSRRGAVRYFLGRFAEAVADFDREVELDPERLAFHWRRGMALYYTGQYEESAAQFAGYHSRDPAHDRESGLWHFLANAERLGVDEARGRMLAYTDPDERPVMNDIYALYAGKKTAGDVLQSIETSQQDDPSRQLGRFYAHLYIGWLAVAEDDLKHAREHLHAALADERAQNAGGGPGYMWHAARVHYDLLIRRQAEAKP